MEGPRVTVEPGPLRALLRHSRRATVDQLYSATPLPSHQSKYINAIKDQFDADERTKREALPSLPYRAKLNDDVIEMLM